MQQVDYYLDYFCDFQNSTTERDFGNTLYKPSYIIRTNRNFFDGAFSVEAVG
jgi:hypothetical protein